MHSVAPMQRGAKVRKSAVGPFVLRQERNSTHPNPRRPADLHNRPLYGVHVRNTSSPGSWATYVTETRQRVGMSKSELARRLGIDRGTVHRWESGQNRPEDAVVVTAFAELFGLNADDALTAAGLRLETTPQAAGTIRDAPLDPDLRVIMRRLADPGVGEPEKMIIRATLTRLAEIADQSERAERPGRAVRRRPA